MEAPLVSWLMPVFNAEKTIRRALDSMLAQTYQNFIIIIIEDGSTDSSAAICHEYAARDARIRVYLNSENLGVGASLNRGLDLCEGKYVARLDADDYSYPERLEKQVDYMELHPDTGVLFSSVRLLVEGGFSTVVKPPLDYEEIRVRLLFHNPNLHNPTVLLNLDMFRRNGWNYNTTDVAEDYALWASLLISNTSFACLQEVLVDYHVGQMNVTVQKKAEIMKNAGEISRKTILQVFGLDSASYNDILFGINFYCDIPLGTDSKDFLASALSLLQELKKLNAEQKLFSDTV